MQSSSVNVEQSCRALYTKPAHIRCNHGPNVSTEELVPPATSSVALPAGMTVTRVGTFPLPPNCVSPASQRTAV